MTNHKTPATHKRNVDTITHGMRIMIDGTASTVRTIVPAGPGRTLFVTYDDRTKVARNGGAIDCPSF
jgi:hypothetical protein